MPFSKAFSSQILLLLLFVGDCEHLILASKETLGSSPSLRPRRSQAKPDDTEVVFEKLCKSYQEQTNTSNKSRLAAFCENRPNSPLSALGYFLLGFTELNKDEYQQAVELLQRANRPQSPIQDYAVYHLALALSGLGRHSEVMATLEGFVDRFVDSIWVDKALTLYWQSAVELRDSSSILSSMKSLPQAESNADALFFAAQAYEFSAASAKAVEHYQRLYYLFPTYAGIPVVTQRLSVLLSSQPAGSFAISEKWMIARIERLFAAKRYREVLKDLDLMVGAGLDRNIDKAEVRLWRGVSEFGTGQYLPAIQTLQELSQSSGDSGAHAEFIIAESYRKLDKYAEFRQAVESMARNHPRNRWREEALFSIGNYNLVRRDLDAAMSFYRAIVDEFPEGLHTADCHWRICWQEYRKSDYRHALELFNEHLTQFANSDYQAAALYWSGRCQQNLGQLSAASRIFELVLQKFPTLYYGQLAKSHLTSLQGVTNVVDQSDPESNRLINRIRSSPDKRPFSDLETLSKTNLDTWPKVNALAQISLFELAARELIRPKVYGQSSIVDFHAAGLFYKAKNFYQASLRLRRVLPNYLELPLGAIPLRIWQMFYPVEYESTIVRESQKYKLDPFMIMALVRQESAFNPSAVSPANAHGLMQLLPSTARRLSKGMKIRRPSISQLHDPELNIRLGTKYFSDLLKRYNGQEDKVLASYNAGENRVDTWLNEGNYADDAEFIETIPFTETRNYVKIIYRNYFFYRELYGRHTRDRKSGV